ncbi:MAG: hypothetical protein ACI92Z_001057 [Paracoccaceae bacterium]|jgi:hypothetical protein
MLGRQKFRFGMGRTHSKRNKFGRHYRRALENAGLSVKLKDLVQEDGYSELMFEGMGPGKVETMDYSDYGFAPQRGGILHDLSQPVPKELHNQFDFIFDGGTLEHVFRMLKPDGCFIGVIP